MSGVVFLLWSNKHEAWWRPGSRGYTANIEEAGEYSEAEAVDRVVQSSLCGDRTKVTCMVAAPSNWSPRLPDVEVIAGSGPLIDVLAVEIEARGYRVYRAALGELHAEALAEQS